MIVLEDVTISEMTLGDVEHVLEVEHTAFPTPWSRRAFLSELMENIYAHYIVARANGKVVGYAGMWVILDEAHITNIAVHADYRGQRVGEQLLDQLIYRARSRGATKMTLEVRKTNAIAQNLYVKKGFEAKGIRKGYYTDNREDAIIMWKYDLGGPPSKVDEVRWMI